MHFHWQSLTAAGIVIFTLLIFMVRLFRPQKKSGCGNDCGCGKPTDSPRP
jgi:hypothetical protein